MVLTVIRQSNTGHVSVWGLCWQGRYILPKINAEGSLAK